MPSHVGSRQAARFVRRIRPRHRPGPCPAASAGLVLAEVAADLPLWGRPALPCPASHPDQPWPLAGRGGAVKETQEEAILVAHVQAPDGLCAGCRAWWSRLAPYPCWQVEWATSRQARTITVRFLEGVR
ncbi:hypothetical protein ACIBXA_32325 [Micromonospora echinaurantiaca]|uniref:hypothetical protein n=1 Tax=Micromonospora echinaurantiaca TaxID=47857 RepID=UPI0037B28EE1